MSCIRLNLIDHDRTISGEVHGSIGDAVIASLSAEPETIHELALGRFVKPIGDRLPLDSLHGEENFEPHDAGIVIVDLAARVIMLDSTFCAPAPIAEAACDDFAEQLDFEVEQDFLPQSDGKGLHDVSEAVSRLEQNQPTTYGIGYHDGEKLTDVWLPYRLPDDWIFLYSVPEYEGVCRRRSAERKNLESFDARAVLFGKQLSEFVAGAILNAPNLEEESLFTEGHAQWLISPHADLQGKSPREFLLAKREFVDFDLHSRELQWSFTGECPPPLTATSHAYRFAGFGTHEIVLYYDLIRLLLDECYKRAHQEKQVSLDDETERLEHIKSAWLETPSGDNQGKAPALIIEWERKRIPLAMSGKAAMIDEDCPVCQAIADDFETPIFWHLDGCNMDERFEFSFFATREAWEADERRREEVNREFDRKWKDREASMLVDEATLLAEEVPF